MSRITLRSGNVLEFSKRQHGIVILLNGRLWMGPQMFLRHLVDACAESGRSVGDLLDELGIENHGTCPFCASGQPRTMCPSCGCVARCAPCAPHHDDSPLCRETLDLADFHRRVRNGDSIEPIDRYHAIKSLASAYERRMVQ